jgi:hypothetical protein
MSENKIRIVQELKLAQVYIEGPNGGLIEGPVRFEDIFDMEKGQLVGFEVDVPLNSVLPFLGLEPFGTDDQTVRIKFDLPAERIVRETKPTDPALKP